jgi:hypothetical protein
MLEIFLVVAKSCFTKLLRVTVGASSSLVSHDGAKEWRLRLDMIFGETVPMVEAIAVTIASAKV